MNRLSLQRLVWFAVLWVAGISALTLVAWIIRWVLQT